MIKDVQLTSDVAAAVPEEAAGLMYAIAELCVGNECGHVISALWLTLISVHMEAHGCSFRQAIKHVQKLAKSTELGTRDEALATFSEQH